MSNKTKILFLVACAVMLASSDLSFAKKEERTLKAAPFFEVQDLFEFVRIPNITVTTDGTVLAFAKSGRLLRRSEDGGESWSPAREVGSDAGGSAIVDENTGNVMVVRAKSGYLWRSRDLGSGVREDYWGVRRKLMQTATGPEDCYVDFPLAKADSLEKIEAHVWPNVDWFDFEGFGCALEPWKDFAVMASGASVLQHPMLLCGMDKILTDMALDPELACCVFDKFTDFYVAYYDKMLIAAQGRIDLFRIGDDIGTQNSLLISPAMFKNFIAPRLKLLVDLAHSHDTKVMFHSCGSITAFIDALIEIGVDILDPIQVSAADMDPAQIKGEYGSRICLHGSIDTQNVLPLGSPQEVAENVEQMIDILGSDGGFILAPCHVLQTDVPSDNVRAMYETRLEYGTYSTRT